MDFLHELGKRFLDDPIGFMVGALIVCWFARWCYEALRGT